MAISIMILTENLLSIVLYVMLLQERISAALKAMEDIMHVVSVKPKTRTREK